jgi:hypothetical protein
LSRNRASIQEHGLDVFLMVPRRESQAALTQKPRAASCASRQTSSGLPTSSIRRAGQSTYGKWTRQV